MARRSFFDQYTQGLTPADFQRLFTRDTPEAYRYFTRHLDRATIDKLPWYRRWFVHARLLFTAFTMRLSPARRVLYAAAIVAATLGLLQLFRGLARQTLVLFPFTVHPFLPQWAPGTLWLLLAFAAVNLLILMEVADRLLLKGDLEIARDIQQAMLPGGAYQAGDTVVCGVTRPANTVGGDFYDILQRADGRWVITVGDVAGKGSPAALLMALLLAMMRTLVDEGLETSRLITRLNVQVGRHSPKDRFITLFYGLYDPATGHLEFVNAGHLPPIIQRRDGHFERVGSAGGGPALGMFDGVSYEAREIVLEPGDLLVLFSDGITEAENARGVPFEESGIEQVLVAVHGQDPGAIGRAVLAAAERHAGDARLADDLTALVMKRGV